MNRYVFSILAAVTPLFGISKKLFKEAFPNNPLTAKIVYAYFNQHSPDRLLQKPALKQLAMAANANIEIVDINDSTITLETRIFGRKIDFDNLDKTILARERKLLSGCLLTAMRNKQMSTPLVCDLKLDASNKKMCMPLPYFLKLDDHTRTLAFDRICNTNQYNSVKCITVISRDQFLELQNACQQIPGLKAITEEICRECIDKYSENGEMRKEDARNFRFRQEGKMLLIEYNFGVIRSNNEIKADPGTYDALNNCILNEIKIRTVPSPNVIKLDSGTRCNAPHFIKVEEGVVRCQTLVTLKQFNKIKERFLKEQAEKNTNKAIENN